MIKISAVSDLHGHLPEILPCDILLLGGDLCPVYNHNLLYQAKWLGNEFKKWLNSVPAKFIYGVAGNHDFVFEKNLQLVPRLPWTYLQDSGAEVLGLNIYGSPWQIPFMDWAFNLPEEELIRKWRYIPDNTDILLLHGPPYGYGDITTERINTGSPSLTKRILEINPKLVICGHIHESVGTYQLGNTVIANVSLVNRNYQPVNPVFTMELDI